MYLAINPILNQTPVGTLKLTGYTEMKELSKTFCLWKYKLRKDAGGS